MGRRAAALIVVTLGTAGCASAPTGPGVLVLPGSGKTIEQFRADDSQCRQLAASELQTVPRGALPDQERYDMVYMQCMYAEGHQIPRGPRRGGQ
jgi:pantothenate kinase type III